MTDQMQAIHDDIAYMKALAQEGRRAPPLGGAILMAGGLIWAATSFTAWAVMVRLVAIPPIWSNAVWLVGLVAFFIALALLIRRHKGKPGHAAVNNRVMRVAWTAGGWSIFAFILALIAACWSMHTSVFVVLIAPFVLTAYGVGWIVAGSVSDGRWLTWIGVGSFLTAILLGFLAGSQAQLLVYTGALLLLMALPGYLLLRQEPSTTV